MTKTERANSAVVLFSGGQDSTTCLAWALDRFSAVHLLSFDYGQRHRIELECRADILRGLSERHEWNQKMIGMETLKVDTLKLLSETALTRDVEYQMQENGLPNTFVPGRNLIFLTYAAAFAYRRGIPNIVAGMCQTDYMGYPDCRDTALDNMGRAIDYGMDTHFEFHYPVLHITKAETWKMANDIGGPGLINLIIERTHTCYSGVRGQKHDWGYGCGTCPACKVRADGFNEFKAELVA